jgi:DinB superfamily
MTKPETRMRYFGITYRVNNMQTSGLTHEDSFIQPTFRGNGLNWVLGHILVGREPVLTYLGESSPWTEIVTSRYKRNSAPITSAEDALPLAQLLSALEESQARIMAGLERIPAETLETRIDDATVGEKITFAHGCPTDFCTQHIQAKGVGLMRIRSDLT